MENLWVMPGASHWRNRSWDVDAVSTAAQCAWRNDPRRRVWIGAAQIFLPFSGIRRSMSTIAAVSGGSSRPRARILFFYDADDAGGYSIRFSEDVMPHHHEAILRPWR